MKKLTWQSIWGRFEPERDGVRFLGEEVEQPTGAAPGFGLAVCDSWFTGGAIETTVTFATGYESSCEIVLYFDPESKFMVTAGVGSAALFNIRHWTQGGGWVIHASSGDRRNLVDGSTYRLRATLRGSSIGLSADGVLAVSTTLPFPLTQSQVGLWFWSRKDIRASRFTVDSSMPQAFIVMPFHGAYDDVDKQVVRKVCEKLKLDPIRADDVAGPGIVVADIASKIRDAQVIIAEITEPNCNVFYEIGYAHALNKPTILLAQEGTKPPFDVSPFRILFYHNTIGGKSKLEVSLRKHISTILYGA